MREQHVAQEDRAACVTPPIVCDQPDDAAAVKALSGYRLHVRFNDGLEGVVEMEAQIHAPDAGVFAALADPDRFAEVGLQFGAVWWPGDLDLAPDAIYAEIKTHGRWVL